jgi:hypothetical protein
MANGSKEFHELFLDHKSDTSLHKFGVGPHWTNALAINLLNLYFAETKAV